jgi:hypothetical protein
LLVFEAGEETRMLHPILRTLVKIALASLVLGTILTHFGITAEEVMRATGLSAERIEDYARKGFAWAWPNLLLGATVIVPVWFLIYLFRPPGHSRSE